MFKVGDVVRFSNSRRMPHQDNQFATITEIKEKLITVIWHDSSKLRSRYTFDEFELVILAVCDINEQKLKKVLGL